MTKKNLQLEVDTKCELLENELKLLRSKVEALEQFKLYAENTINKLVKGMNLEPIDYISHYLNNHLDIIHIGILN